MDSSSAVSAALRCVIHTPPTSSHKLLYFSQSSIRTSPGAACIRLEQLVDPLTHLAAREGGASSKYGLLQVVTNMIRATVMRATCKTRKTTEG